MKIVSMDCVWLGLCPQHTTHTADKCKMKEDELENILSAVFQIAENDCVCVWEREREWERDREMLCARIYTHAYYGTMIGQELCDSGAHCAREGAKFMRE